MTSTGASEIALWAASGAMDLTGLASGPPMVAPGRPASFVADALATIGRLHPDAPLPGVGLLGERAAAARLHRRAPWSAGGAFRVLRTADGSIGLSLPRPWDIEALPALVEASVTDPWEAVTQWATRMPTRDAVDRARLLGLACAPIGQPPGGISREPVVVTPGGLRDRRPERPFVVDLSSLWAGPLCGRLLALTGADVAKVESAGRPDGARQGPPAFFELMHSGKREVVVDTDTPGGRTTLADLIGRADVVIEASRPRALQRLGVDAAEHVAAGTVWVSITAYGRAVDAIGFGDDVAAGAGLLRDGFIPCGDALADPLTGVAAAAATLTALESGRGALLDVSMHHVAASATGTLLEHEVSRDGDRWYVEDATGRYAVEPPRLPPDGTGAGSNLGPVSSRP